MSDLSIYHNPRCSKSRQTLKLLEEKGHKPAIILYLKDSPGASEIKNLLEKLGINAAQLIRRKEALYKELGLKGKADDALIQAMADHPKLIERPIVVLGEKAKIGRPPEGVLDLF
ncbi:MAG: arsenate reductase (glutaredoxin) [Planctomycetota bacterium]|nr:arsenate reductase (glutaredoxin) [Planctomycetota bacterium]